MKTIACALKLFEITLPLDADTTEQERLFRWELSCVDNLVKPDQIMDLVNIQTSDDKTHLYIMKLYVILVFVGVSTNSSHKIICYLGTIIYSQYESVGRHYQHTDGATHAYKWPV